MPARTVAFVSDFTTLPCFFSIFPAKRRKAGRDPLEQACIHHHPVPETETPQYTRPLERVIGRLAKFAVRPTNLGDIRWCGVRQIPARGLLPAKSCFPLFEPDAAETGSHFKETQFVDRKQKR